MGGFSVMGLKAEAGDKAQARRRRGIESMKAKGRQGDPHQDLLARIGHPLHAFAFHQVDHRIEAAARQMVDVEDTDPAHLDAPGKDRGGAGAQRAVGMCLQRNLVVGDQLAGAVMDGAQGKVALAGARRAAQEKAG